MQLIKFLCVALAFPAAVFASGAEDLNYFLNSVKTASGEFAQQVADKNGKPAQESSAGDFVFSRPGKFAWEYKTPYAQLMLSDGKTLWVWDKDLNQVTERKLKGALPASPASVLFGSSNVSKDWKIEELGEEEGLTWIKLTPKQKDSAFSEVLIGFKDRLPRSMKFVGSLGERSSLTLGNLKINEKIEKSRFDFKAPAGTDVLKVD